VRKSKPPVFDILRPFQVIQEKIEDRATVAEPVREHVFGRPLAGN
jgi:hypothetical protein